MVVLSTFLAIVELLGGAVEFPSPTGPRGWVLLKLLVLGVIFFLVGYSVTFLGGWI